MKTMFAFAIALSLVTQNFALARDRVSAVVVPQVAEANESLRATRLALGMVDSQLARLEDEVGNLKNKGEIARYAALGLSGVGLVLSGYALACSKGYLCHGDDTGIGSLIVGALGISAGAASSVSHFVYRLQRGTIDSNQAQIEIAEIQSTLGKAQQAASGDLAKSLNDLIASLVEVQSEIESGSNALSLNNIMANVAHVLAAAGVGLAVGGRTGILNNSTVLFGAIASGVSALPTLISTLSDTNKEEVLEKVASTRRAVAKAREALEKQN